MKIHFLPKSADLKYFLKHQKNIHGILGYVGRNGSYIKIKYKMLLKVLSADPVDRYNEFFDEITLSQSGNNHKSFIVIWAGVLGWVSTTSSRRGYIY